MNGVKCICNVVTLSSLSTSRTFSLSKQILYTHWTEIFHSFLSALTPTPGNHYSTFCSVYLPLQVLHLSGIIQYLTFCTCFITLRIMLSRFICCWILGLVLCFGAVNSCALNTGACRIISLSINSQSTDFSPSFHLLSPFWPCQYSVDQKQKQIPLGHAQEPKCSGKYPKQDTSCFGSIQNKGEWDQNLQKHFPKFPRMCLPSHLQLCKLGPLSCLSEPHI